MAKKVKPLVSADDIKRLRNRIIAICEAAYRHEDGDVRDFDAVWQLSCVRNDIDRLIGKEQR